MNGLRPLLFLIIIFWLACSGSRSSINVPKLDASRIADEVMNAQGGLKNWEATRVISWNFYGVRTLVWDKWTGDLRVNYLKRDLKIILNLNTMKGRVWLDGAETTQPDSLAKYLERGRRVWINDSYWLVMPFKLKDPGVNLKFIGPSKTADGQPADLLELTFQNVGVTPENKYQIWVDEKSRLVTQWAFFKKFSDEKADFINPWADYQQYGRIKLSGNRGGDNGAALSSIAVFGSPPAGVFSNF